MATVIIIGLIVVVVSLIWIATQQAKAVKKYEEELLTKNTKTVKVGRVKKNVSVK